MNQPPFFVYGTLLPNQPNHHLLQADTLQAAPASLAGCRLYDMGHFPMLVEAAAGQVRGMVVTVRANAYQAVLTRLDRLERYDPADLDRSLFRRQLRPVQQSDKGFVEAWVYQGRATQVGSAVAIPGGDWAAYSARVYPDLHTWWADTGRYGRQTGHVGNSPQIGQNQ